MSPPARVRIYSKPGCHLCDDARAVIEAVCAELGESFDEVDISADEILMHEYGEQIPVTFVDGSQHDFWRVDPRRLRAALGARADLAAETLRRRRSVSPRSVGVPIWLLRSTSSMPASSPQAASAAGSHITRSTPDSVSPRADDGFVQPFTNS